MKKTIIIILVLSVVLFAVFNLIGRAVEKKSVPIPTVSKPHQTVPVQSDYCLINDCKG